MGSVESHARHDLMTRFDTDQHLTERDYVKHLSLWFVRHSIYDRRRRLIRDWSAGIALLSSHLTATVVFQ
jgi:hypothetical protein